MLSQKNKKNTTRLFLGLLIGTFFFLSIGTLSHVSAQTFNSNSEAVAGVQNADNVPEDEGIFTKGIKYLLYGILWILTGLVQSAASVFAWATRPEYISAPTGLLNLTSVYSLWKFIRDFFNLFFIFLLLFSAFATVFQIEKFGIKKNFLNIVFAAIAINFSFPLTRIIIDFGNVLMYFLAEGLVTAGGQGNVLKSIPEAFFASSGIAEIGVLPDPATPGTLIPLLTSVIFMFIFMITLFTLAILFVIRLLKLVIILIFSPLGVAASIVPGMESLGKKWWDNLLQTVFFGPAAMLMVVIALRFTYEINGSGFAQGLSATAPAANASSQSSIIRQGVFFVPVILMWMAMHVGNKFGIEGANMVMAKADKVLDWGKRAALWAPKAAGRTIGRKIDSKVAGASVGIRGKRYNVGRYFSVGAWKKALKDRAEEQKRHDEQPIELAAGKLQDNLNTGVSALTNTINPFNMKNRNRLLLGRSTDKTDHRFAQRRRQAHEYRKEIADTSERSDYVIHELKDAIAQGNAAKVEGAIEILLKNNDINELVQSLDEKDLKAIGFDKAFDTEVEVMDAEGKIIKQKLAFAERQIEDLDSNGNRQFNTDGSVRMKTTRVLNTNTENYRHVLKNLYDTVGISGEEQAKAFMTISDQGQASGNFALGGLSGFNAAAHEFQVNSVKAQAEYAAMKFSNMEAQAQAKFLHPDSLFEKDYDGNVVGFNGATADSIIGSFTMALGTQANRMRPDTLSGWKAIMKSNHAAVEKMYDNAAPQVKFAMARMLQQAGAIGGQELRQISDAKKTYAELIRDHREVGDDGEVSPGAAPASTKEGKKKKKIDTDEAERQYQEAFGGKK